MKPASTTRTRKPDAATRGSAHPAARPALRRRDRLTRTIVLGTVAVGLAIAWVAVELDLDRDVLLDYLMTAFVFVAVPIVFALLAVGLMRLLRRLGRRIGRGSDGDQGSATNSRSDRGNQ